MKVDFERQGTILQECINRAGGSSRWESEGQKCFESYKRGVQGDVEGEVSRILRLVG